MRKTLTRYLATLSFMALLGVGCGKGKGTESEPTGLRLAPLPDAEAEYMALWLSGEIEAPIDLYKRIQSDLKRIRGSSFNTANFDSLSFTAPWQASMIIIGLDSAMYTRLANHESPLWDSLNTLYQAYIAPSEDGRTYFPHFPGRLNPERLSELYAQVPGVKYAQPNHVGRLGGWHKFVYPGQLGGDTLTYVFQRGHGFYVDLIDIPLPNNFWCFLTIPESASYAGVYEQADGRTFKDAPDWWGDFCHAVIAINFGVSCGRSGSAP